AFLVSYTSYVVFCTAVVVFVVAPYSSLSYDSIEAEPIHNR
ncbi:unnamed protein product, partial [marine sediment metagenome]